MKKSGNINIKSLSGQYQDPTTNVPSEVLQIIFYIACGGPCPTSEKLILGAVCSRWREIAWSFPALWTDFVFVGSPSEARHHLELHARNARGLALSVDLGDIRGYGSRCAYELYECIFVKSASRLCSLKLGFIATTPTWESIIDLVDHANFPQLKTLEFYESFPALLPWCARLPHLSDLSCHSINPDNSSFSLDRLTSLTLFSIHPNDAVYILSRCPNLITFKTWLQHDKGPILAPDPVLSQDIVLPHISSFTWFDDTDPFDPRDPTTPVHHLLLPKVRDLTWVWGGYQIEPGCWNSWKHFFQHMENLQTVHIHINAECRNKVNHVKEFMVIFGAHPVRQMRLGISCWPVSSLSECIKHLVLPRKLGPPLFPLLESLEIMYRPINRAPFLRNLPPDRWCVFNSDLNVFNVIVQMLASRRQPALPDDHTPLLRFQLRAVSKLSGSYDDFAFGLDIRRLGDVQWRSQHFESLLRVSEECLDLNGKDMDLIVADCQAAEEEEDKGLTLLPLRRGN